LTRPQQPPEAAHPGVGDRPGEGAQLGHPGHVQVSIVNRVSLVAHHKDSW
jgi:hypothetical protein